MKRICTFILYIIPVIMAGQDKKTELDKMVDDAHQDMSSIVETFNQKTSEMLESYLEYEMTLKNEYEEYSKKTMAEWGDAKMIESSKKTWVEYGADNSSRTIVDFETGKVSVEIIADNSENQESLKRRMETAVGNLLTSRGRSLGFTSKVAKDQPITSTPIMNGQLDLTKIITSASQPAVSSSLNKGTNLNLSRRASTPPKASSESAGQTMADKAKSHNAATKPIQQLIVETITPSTQQVSTGNGEKQIMKIELELVEDHIPKRAEQFKNIISDHARKFDVEEPLIYAIMEQESAFNPAARSHVPAYGLMQLVPKSGGRDAYRFVHRQDQIPTANFLYDPYNNIELGTGYLKLLMTTSFAKVTDYRCRMLCAIAAYNTGAGNVSRAITGNTNISKAIPQINAMDYNQLFNHLKCYLPHDETKDYIQKVSSKMQKYIRR